jgi:hypothetical protein
MSAIKIISLILSAIVVGIAITVDEPIAKAAGGIACVRIGFILFYKPDKKK